MRALVTLPSTWAVATAHELKHQLQTLVTALAHATLQQLHTRHQQRARVGQFDSIRVALNHHATLAAMVSVHKYIHHRLVHTSALPIQLAF